MSETLLSSATLYSVAAGLSVFSLVLYFYSTYREYLAEHVAAAAEIGGEATSFAFRILKPFARFFGRVLSAVFVQMEKSVVGGGIASYLLSFRLKLQRWLVSAGRPEGLTADEYLGLACFSVLVWGGIGLAAWLASGWGFFILAGFVVGIAHPATWLRRKLYRRQNEIRKLLPYALDLLTLSVEAGLDFTSALARLVPKMKGAALAEEFHELLRVIRLGRSRRDALRDMSERLNMPEVTSFTSSLVQADELGASIGNVLRVQCDQMRSDRANRAEKKAMEAPVKILFPLIAFIFPTVFIILFAPIGIGYLAKLFGR